jgi:hypothetical protein
MAKQNSCLWIQKQDLSKSCLNFQPNFDAEIFFQLRRGWLSISGGNSLNGFLNESLSNCQVFQSCKTDTACFPRHDSYGMMHSVVTEFKLQTLTPFSNKDQEDTIKGDTKSLLHVNQAPAHPHTSKICPRAYFTCNY